MSDKKPEQATLSIAEPQPDKKLYLWLSTSDEAAEFYPYFGKNWVMVTRAATDSDLRVLGGKMWPVPGQDMAGNLRKLREQFENFSGPERVTMLHFLREMFSELTGENRK